MIAQVRPAELDTWLQAARDHGRPVVLDVREPAELQAASISADAAFDLVAIPMGSIPQRLHDLDPSRPIACLCHHGARSMRVAAFLQANGFAEVVNIAGGIDAWSAERDPAVPRY